MYSIKQAKDTVYDGIRTYLEKDEAGNYLMDEVNCLPLYLEGAPGIGKTQIVGQLATEMNLGFVSFSLVHHTRNSLLGLPVISELDSGEKYTKFTISEIIAKVYEQIEKGYKEGILLLDEFPCMSESLMPAMLAFLQTKNIGTHALPRGWVLVLCGNPAKYNKSTHTFDAAITDRIRKIEIEYSTKDFLEYAREHKLSEYIISYLELNPGHLYRFVMDKQNSELVTCRSWENLSHTLTISENLNNKVDEKLVGQFIKSDEIANRFTFFYRNQITGMDIKEAEAVLDGTVSPKTVQKYMNIPLRQKWNITAYLVSILGSDIDRYVENDDRLLFAKTLLGEVSLEKNMIFSHENCSFSKDLLWVLEEISFGNYGTSTFEAFGKKLKEKMNRYILSETQQISSEVSDMIEKWCLNSKYDSFSEAEDIALARFVTEVNNWIEEQKTILNNSMQILEKRVANTFKFLKEIDETGAMSECLYVEICNNNRLLKVMYKTESSSFMDLSRKHFGIKMGDC